jgi:hypothetical protein
MTMWPFVALGACPASVLLGRRFGLPAQTPDLDGETSR